jgi:hypothetical protein
MYLFLTRSTLDIFNCAPTDPPDGKLYLQVLGCRVMQCALDPFSPSACLLVGAPKGVGWGGGQGGVLGVQGQPLSLVSPPVTLMGLVFSHRVCPPATLAGRV